MANSLHMANEEEDNPGSLEKWPYLIVSCPFPRKMILVCYLKLVGRHYFIRSDIKITCNRIRLCMASKHKQMDPLMFILFG